jgi:hypothetical protein
VVWFLGADPVSSLLGIGGLIAAVLAIKWFRNDRRVRTITSVAHDQGEFLYQYRSDLERRLRAARRAPVFALLPWLLLWSRLQELPTSAPKFWALLGLLSLSAVGALYSFGVRRPWLQRQLDALRR